MDNARSIAIPMIDGESSLEAQAEMMAEQMRLLVQPGQVVELRALHVEGGQGRTHHESGFFDCDHILDMVFAALKVTPRAKGVYFTLNPVDPDLLARRCNRVGWAKSGESASDKDILQRRWLLVDVDPVRKAHISATDAEKQCAYDTVLEIREYLRSQAWPEPLLADSGNGYHLLYHIELPANDQGLVERILKSLAIRFDSEHATVDQSVHNPARICKIPGTWARKGDSTNDRPHRRAALLEVPSP